MSYEHSIDNEAILVMKSLRTSSATNKLLKHFIIIEDTLYYISDTEDDSCLRLLIPEKLREVVVKEYHDSNGHMGVQKTFDVIRQKYYWPHLFKHIHQYVTICLICHTRSLQKIKQPLQETDFPPYAMAKLSFDLSGHYPVTFSRNKYIVAFV